MVDEITPSYTIYHTAGKYAIHVLFEGFNGANEFGIFDSWSDAGVLDFTPKGCTIIVTAGGTGTDTTIDVDVDVSMNNVTYTTSDINNLTTFDTYDHHPAYGAAQDEGHVPWRYWKVLVVDPGTNRVNQVDMWLYEGY